MMQMVNPLPTVPAVSLEAAVAVARTVAGKDGRMTRDQIAVALGNKKASGNANGKVLAAQRFGLIQRSAEGTYSITDTGRRFVAGHATAEDARKSIGRIKSYAKVVEELGWELTPAAQARIDAILKKAGVPTGAVVEARRVLLRSIVVLGQLQSAAPTPVLAPRTGDQVEGGSRGSAEAPRIRLEPPSPALAGGGASLPFSEIPAIKEMLNAAPGRGSSWPRGQQDDFVEALRHFIRFAYPGAD